MVDEGTFAMSTGERDRLRVIEAVCERRMKQGQAGARLGLSVRQIKRLVRAYRRHGARALVSKRRGHPSNRRIPARERDHFLGLIRRHYRDFGPTLACEYLTQRHGFTRSVPTLRRWMIEAGLWQARTLKRKRPFQLRERRPALGELVQIDGSPHAWFEDRAAHCTLIIFVDDATSRVQYARFEPVESTRAYLQALRRYVSQHGLPVSLYSDRHSIFRKHAPEDPKPTQFERAVRTLAIEPILALTPQAKGRVERTFQTLQDRLVKAMRLAKVRTLVQANAWLPTFLSAYNERFARPPRFPEDAHRPVPVNPEQLTWITCEQQQRTLSKSLSCQYLGRQFLIQTQGSAGYHLRGARITVCDDGPGTAPLLLYKGKALPYRVFQRHDIPQRIADDKTVNVLVDTAIKRQARKHPSPPPNHPWKRSFKPTQSAQP
jgi:transposase